MTSEFQKLNLLGYQDDDGTPEEEEAEKLEEGTEDDGKIDFEYGDDMDEEEDAQ